jgi:hypothetical protein
LLLPCVFEACSSDQGATPNPFNEPPTLEISAISLGSGSIGQGGDSSLLACDDTIGITLTLQNWRPEPPGKCGSTPQCGQIRVSLLGADGAVVSSTSSAAVGVNLDVTRFVEDGTLKAGSYTIQAQLVDDAGGVYPITDGGNSSAERSFTLRLKDGCASGAAGANSGGASSEGGMAGMPNLSGAGAGGDSGASGAAAR